MWLYAGSVQYVVSILFASLCYFMTGLKFFNIHFMFVFLFCKFVFYFVYSVLFCVSCLLLYVAVSCFCTSLPTAATG